MTSSLPGTHGSLQPLALTGSTAERKKRDPTNKVTDMMAQKEREGNMVLGLLLSQSFSSNKRRMQQRRFNDSL
jgi:hypothetical protein